MIIPLNNLEEIRIYTCPICQQTYRAQHGNLMMSCAVMHAPGTCCHYREERISKKQVDGIHQLLAQQSAESTTGEK